MSTDLFTGMEVDYGRPRPNLERIRRLVERVEALEECVDFWPDCCFRVATHARNVGAHSVARAVEWLTHPETLERHGHDAMHIRAEKVARTWLERAERRLMEDA